MTLTTKQTLQEQLAVYTSLQQFTFNRMPNRLLMHSISHDTWSVASCLFKDFVHYATQSKRETELRIALYSSTKQCHQSGCLALKALAIVVCILLKA